MANPFVMWSAVPVGSTFKLTCDGDSKVLDGMALVTLNGAPKPGFEVSDFCPGPATSVLGLPGAQLEVTVTVIATKKLNAAFTLTASAESAPGKPVLVPDGKGNMIPAQASWKSGTSAGSTVDIAVLINVAVPPPVPAVHP